MFSKYTRPRYTTYFSRILLPVYLENYSRVTPLVYFKKITDYLSHYTPSVTARLMVWVARIELALRVSKTHWLPLSYTQIIWLRISGSNRANHWLTVKSLHHAWILRNKFLKLLRWDSYPSVSQVLRYSRPDAVYHCKDYRSSMIVYCLLCGSCFPLDSYLLNL